jgi:hypothetical protein
MIWLNPKSVTLLGAALGEVKSVAIDERAERLVVEFADTGPHPAFADVPERRTTIKIRRRVISNEALGLALGDLGAFSMRTAPNNSDGPGVNVSAEVVLTHIGCTVDRAGGAEQVIEAVAVSADGAAAPVTVAADGGV